MQRRIFHGKLKPADIAQALLAEFNRTNLHAQAMGAGERMIVQIASRPGAMSGGQTAITVTIEKAPDGVMIQMGQQAWIGTATSLGWTALTALRNPLSLLNRLDDLAQDFENLQLAENIWQVIGATAQKAGASYELSERFKRITCDYCGAANPLGEPTCLMCGAPLGNAQPRTCRSCGFVVYHGEKTCPNCGKQV